MILSEVQLIVLELCINWFARGLKLLFTSLALAAVLAEKVWGRLWPIDEIGTNHKKRKVKDTKNVFKVFISTPFMVLLPVV